MVPRGNDLARTAIAPLDDGIDDTFVLAGSDHLTITTRAFRFSTTYVTRYSPLVPTLSAAWIGMNRSRLSQRVEAQFRSFESCELRRDPRRQRVHAVYLGVVSASLELLQSLRALQ